MPFCLHAISLANSILLFWIQEVGGERLVTTKCYCTRSPHRLPPSAPRRASGLVLEQLNYFQHGNYVSD